MLDTDWDLISSYVGLVGLASVSICCGAFDSLPTSPRDKTVRKQSLLQDAEEDDDDDDDDSADRMSSGDAWLFPIVGSVTLFGMYVVVTYVGKEWINWFLGWYFAITGVGSVWKSAVSLAKLVIGQEKWRTFTRNRLLLLRGPLEVISLSFRTPTVLLLPVGVLPCVLYSFSSGSHKSVLWTDVLALSFSHNALSILKLDSFQTGCILLSGLFVYDVFWVFGTDVMVKVATSLDVPIKLLWPKSVTFSAERGFTMLGLGDVVIPGMFIALALRYDHARGEKTRTSFSKKYFLVTLTAYVVGLIATMTVMHTFGKAQPALLYLSPACILSLVGTAVIRGELEDVWKWSDDPKGTPENTERVTRTFPDGQNGNRAPQPRDSADGSDQTGAEVVEEGEEGPEVRGKKGKNRGKKKV